MKIKINQNEIYEIRFDEEVSPRQFQELLIRLNNINKLIGRDPLLSLNNTFKDRETQSRRTYQKMSWVKDRDLCVKVLKLHYHGIGEQKREFAKRNGKTWEDITKNLYSIRKRFNITPEEIGLKSYPKQGSGPFVMSEHKQRDVLEEEFNIDDIIGDNVVPQQTISVNKGFRPWSKSKEGAVSLLKLHYFGKKSDKLKFAEKMGISWDDIVKCVHNLVIKWSITPEEIGIPFFPQKGNPNKSIFELKRILIERRTDYIPTENNNEFNEDSDEPGIIHYGVNGKYGCNESVNPTASKLSKDWSKITCDNCKRIFGRAQQ